MGVQFLLLLLSCITLHTGKVQCDFLNSLFINLLELHNWFLFHFVSTPQLNSWSNFGLLLVLHQCGLICKIKNKTERQQTIVIFCEENEWYSEMASHKYSTWVYWYETVATGMGTHWPVAKMLRHSLQIAASYTSVQCNTHLAPPLHSKLFFQVLSMVLYC